jgi:hypothetical protein
MFGCRVGYSKNPQGAEAAGGGHLGVVLRNPTLLTVKGMQKGYFRALIRW